MVEQIAVRMRSSSKNVYNIGKNYEHDALSVWSLIIYWYYDLRFILADLSFFRPKHLRNGSDKAVRKSLENRNFQFKNLNKPFFL